MYLRVCVRYRERRFSFLSGPCAVFWAGPWMDGWVWTDTDWMGRDAMNVEWVAHPDRQTDTTKGKKREGFAGRGELKGGDREGFPCFFFLK